MRLIPVLDLMGGQIVHGTGGRRQEYRPIASGLCTSPDPLDVSKAFLEKFALTELYLADLDAIAGAAPALAVYAAIRTLGCSLWVDAGIRDAQTARALAGASVEGVVAGLETLRGPEVLDALCEECGDNRVIFSLDLKAGLPIGDQRTWGSDVNAIAARAVAAGVSRLIVLDLARVGGAEGTGTEDLCATLARAHAHVDVIAGGGVASVHDLRRLERCGVSAVLLASALHDGRIRANDLLEFRV